jgi:hypothetical protein
VEENFKQAELKRIKEERAKRLADKQREEDLRKIAVSFLLIYLILNRRYFLKKFVPNMCIISRSVYR